MKRCGPKLSPLTGSETIVREHEIPRPVHANLHPHGARADVGYGQQDSGERGIQRGKKCGAGIEEMASAEKNAAEYERGWSADGPHEPLEGVSAEGKFFDGGGDREQVATFAPTRFQKCRLYPPAAE